MSKMQDIQDWLRKYLFWCLCGLIAIFSLTAWWFGVGTLNDKTKANVADIEKQFTATNNVTSTIVTGGAHPNETVNKQLTDLTLKTRETVLRTWKALYDRQKTTIFKWPAILDQEFIDWINSNPPDAEIPPNQLVEYQNKVLKELERIVTQVANAEWPDAVAAAAAASNSASSGFGRNFGGERDREDGSSTMLGPGIPGESEKLLWAHDNITAWKNRYNWRLRPTSTDVRLAQEDLWVLEQLCSVIAQVNGKIPPYQRPIKVVDSIAVEGFAIDGVGGQPRGINSNRLLRMQAATTAAAAGGEVTPTEEATVEGATTEGAPVVSAPPARLGGAFQGSSGRGGGGGGREEDGGREESPAFPERDERTEVTTSPAGTSSKPEDELYEWRYIDQAGYPLSKAQLDGEHKADLYRMVPFKIQMHIVQAALPKLLESLKNAPLTLEVSQIRINAENNAANQFAGLTKTTGLDSGQFSSNYGSDHGSPGIGTNSLLPGEVILEIHGAAYLAQPYDEKKLPLPDSIATDEGT